MPDDVYAAHAARLRTTPHTVRSLLLPLMLHYAAFAFIIAAVIDSSAMPAVFDSAPLMLRAVVTMIRCRHRCCRYTAAAHCCR